MFGIELQQLKALDDVFFLHPEKGWIKSWVVSHIQKKNTEESSVHKILLAGYGPPVPAEQILSEDEYYIWVKNGNLASFTNSLLSSLPNRDQFTFSLCILKYGDPC